MFGNNEEFGALSRKGMEALAASAAAWTRGVQEIVGETAEMSRRNMEKSTQAAEKALGAKSVEEAVETQQTLARESFATWMEQASRLGEVWMKTARESWKPFEETFTEAFDIAAKGKESAPKKAGK